MKRKLSVFMAFMISLMVLSPITVHAKSYHLGGTDMSIQVDDTSWYVFTRDNMTDNPEMEELGISFEAMSDFFHANEAYMDAILYYEDGEYTELFVRKRTLDSGMVNLSNYSDKEVLELAKGIAQEQGIENYSVYENQYKFAVLEYTDEDLGYYVCEFVTVVNRYNYTVTFQSTVPFGDWEYNEIQNILDSIEFEVDDSLKEKRFSLDWGSLAGSALTGAIAGGLGCGIFALIKSKKKTVNKSRGTDSADDAGLN